MCFSEDLQLEAVFLCWSCHKMCSKNRWIGGLRSWATWGGGVVFFSQRSPEIERTHHTFWDTPTVPYGKEPQNSQIFRGVHSPFGI